MFEVEITPGLQNGEITMDSGDVISEIQDSLGLSEEEGEEVVEKIITEGAVKLFAQTNSCVLRGMDAMAGDCLKKLLQYAAFVDGDLGLEVTEEQAQRAYNIYEALDFDGIEEEKVEEQKALLRKALNISS